MKSICGVISIGFVAVLVAVLVSLPAFGQIASPRVNDDRSVTFQTYAPRADSVILKGIEGLKPRAMSRGEQGLWQITVGPLDPELYSYTFEIDGADQVDRFNRSTKAWFWLESLVEVPGDPPLLHERQTVPHGVVHHHTFMSNTAGGDHGLFVYTPPDYDAQREGGYPLVVLLHGFGDDESAWVDVGRAPEIADNMIAAGSIVPPVIAMPYGHPVPVASRRFQEDYAEANAVAMESLVLDELLPMLSSRYNLTDGADARAIVGLSMGGGQSLRIGLRNPDMFSYVGGFSSSTPDEDREELVEILRSRSDEDPLRLLWIGCGRDDFLYQRNTAFSTWIRDRGIDHTFEVTEGAHTWLVWRRYLQTFLPLLFRG